jgi:hypothetical protein
MSTRAVTRSCLYEVILNKLLRIHHNQLHGVKLSSYVKTVEEKAVENDAVGEMAQHTRTVS